MPRWLRISKFPYRVSYLREMCQLIPISDNRRRLLLNKHLLEPLGSKVWKACAVLSVLHLLGDQYPRP